MACCPYCRSHIDAAERILVNLDKNVVIHGDNEWRVHPQLAVFVNALVEAWPRSVDYLELGQAIWGAFEEPEHARRMLFVYASRARRIVETFGGRIETVSAAETSGKRSHMRAYRLVLPMTHERISMTPHQLEAVHGGIGQ